MCSTSRSAVGDVDVVLDARQHAEPARAAASVGQLVRRVNRFVIQSSAVIGYRWSSGTTPMIVYGVALMRTVLPIDAGIAAEVAAPESLADHDHVRRALSSSPSAKNRPASGATRSSVNQLALTRTPCTRSASAPSRTRFAVVPSITEKPTKLRRARAIVDEVHRRADVAVALLRVPNAHEMIGLRKGQRLEQHAVHDAEDRGVRADPERERDDRGEREGRRGAQLSKRRSRCRARGRSCSRSAAARLRCRDRRRRCSDVRRPDRRTPEGCARAASVVACRAR